MSPLKLRQARQRCDLRAAWSQPGRDRKANSDRIGTNARL